jgi:hypothetical protein
MLLRTMEELRMEELRMENGPTSKTASKLK